MAKKEKKSHKKKKKKDKALDDDESFLSIDPDRLDKEWLGQPGLFFEWAERAASARQAHDRAKVERDVVKADLSRSIREDPVKFDLEKVTESQVTAAILLQPEFKEAEEAVADAAYAMRMADAAVTALDHRRRALENLVHLHGQNYFSSPRSRDENSEQFISETTKKSARRGSK